MRFNKFLFFIVISGFISCNSTKSISTNAATLGDNIVIAHRGAWKTKHLPENSIASLKNAIALRYAGSEFDVHMTADDSLVINHDPTYNHLVVEKTSYADLMKFKLSNGEKLPTLREYLKAGFQKNPHTMLICEIKPSDISKERGKLIAERIVKMVHEYNVENIVRYISFDYDILLKILEIEPSAKTQYLNGTKSPETLKQDGITGMDYHFSIFKKHPEWIASAKKNHIILNAWTVDDPADMDWLIVNGFNYITTNQPELLSERIKKSPVNEGWKLSWSEEFNYNGFPDSTKWNYAEGGEGYGNRELQYYTKADTNNVIVKDGKLFITALKQTKGKNEYTSARLNTQNKAEFKYGRIEIRAKLPAGRGTWPAIWMLGKNRAEAGWPTCGEIDIMEHVGYDKDTIHGTIHTQAYNHMKGTQKGKTIFIENPYTAFHTFSIEWSPEKIDFLMDGVVYNHIVNEHLSVNEWPFDQPFYLILNLAVGGDWGGRKGIDESIFPATMVVDYVRVFEKNK